MRALNWRRRPGPIGPVHNISTAGGTRAGANASELPGHRALGQAAVALHADGEPDGLAVCSLFDSPGRGEFLHDPKTAPVFLLDEVED